MRDFSRDLLMKNSELTILDSSIMGVNSSLIIIFFALVVSGDINYVKPYGYAECPDEPCLTFDVYTNNTDKYFISNANFAFLSGIHIIIGLSSI